MFESLKLGAMAQALAAHAGARQSLVAQNIANADTPGYKARDLESFADTVKGGDGLRATRAGHIGGSSSSAAVVQAAMGADPNGNSVELDQEMIRAVDVRQEHDMALSVYRATSNIMRAALGGS